MELRNKWHIVERKTQIMQHVLNNSIFPCCL